MLRKLPKTRSNVSDGFQGSSSRDNLNNILTSPNANTEAYYVSVSGTIDNPIGPDVSESLMIIKNRISSSLSYLKEKNPKCSLIIDTLEQALEEIKKYGI